MRRTTRGGLLIFADDPAVMVLAQVRTPVRTVPADHRRPRPVLIRSRSIPCPTRRRESVPEKAAGAVRGAAGEAATRRRRDSDCPRRAVVADRLASLLTVVKPDTLIRWHRKGFRLFWRWKSRPRGRPRLPADLQRLIADMAAANRTWGEERIAVGTPAEAWDSRVAADGPALHADGAAPRGGARSQPWSTFVRNHASAVLGVRFLRHDHGHVSRGLRLRGLGRRHATDPALECDRPSDGGLDGAAVPNGGVRRRAASIPDSRPRQHLLRRCRSNASRPWV